MWALTKPRRLNAATLRIIEQEPVIGSALSVWEILLTQSEGRLRLPEGSLIRTIERAGAEPLPLRPEPVEAAGAFGALHGDPVDRMLIRSARV